MIIKEIKLSNFRNFKNIKCEFDPKINIIYGKNGSGKTNLVEGIYYSSIARSFRKIDDNSLIKINENSFVINSKFLIDDLNKNIDIEYKENSKKILLNNHPLNKISNLTKLIKIIYFYPKDVLLLKESPKSRRDFMNLSISQYDDTYLDNLIKYNYYLKERNKELKKDNPDDILLDVYLEKMGEIALSIYSYRKKYFKDIEIHLNYIFNKITLRNENLKIHYLAFIDNSLDYKENYIKKIKECLNEDKLKKTTTKGIHLEDFYISLSDKNVSKFGSQGENRMVILSLKLAPFFMNNEKSIIILDDVLSELDESNKNNFLNLLDEFDQVFITNTYRINDDKFKNIDIEKLINQDS